MEPIADRPPSNRRRLLLRLVVFTPLLCLLVLALWHPYPRQLAFGPKVQGEPVWYWQKLIRQECDPQANAASPLTRLMEFLGYRRTMGFSVSIPWNDPGMMPVLLGLLEDPNPEVRRSMAVRLAMRRPTPPEAEAPLMRLLDDPVPEVRSAAMVALSAMEQQSESTLQRLRAELTDPDPLCRVTAASVVWQLDKDAESALPILRQGLQDPNRDVRARAASSLGAMKAAAEPALPELAAAAHSDTDIHVRRIAIHALGSMGSKALPSLLPLFNDTDPGVHWALVQVVQQLGPEAREAVPHLRRLRADPSLHGFVRRVLTEIAPDEFPALPENEAR